MLYGSRKSVGGSCASYVLRKQRVLRATNPRPSGLVALDQSRSAKATLVSLHSAERGQSYSRRFSCWQNYIDTTRCCHRMMHAAGGRSTYRNAARRLDARSSSNGTSEASVGAAVYYCCVIPGMVRVMWWDERCDGFKTRFRLTFSTGRSSRIAQSKKLSQ